MQAQQRQHLEHDAAVAVHDRLRQAGGAAGIDDPQRMIERQPGRLERVDRARRVLATMSASRASGAAARGLAVQDDVLDARQRSPQLRDDVLAVMRGAAIGDAVAGDQHLRLDLPEAVEHGGRPHVGRTDAPDRADAGARQERDDRLGDVGQVGRDPVAGLDALRPSVQRERRHLAPQLGPARFAELAVLAATDDRRQAGGIGGLDMAEHLPRVVDLRAGEPAPRPASCARRARPRTASAIADRNSPRCCARSRRDRAPTTATSPRNSRRKGHAARRASCGRGRSGERRVRSLRVGFCCGAGKSILRRRVAEAIVRADCDDGSSGSASTSSTLEWRNTFTSMDSSSRASRSNPDRRRGKPLDCFATLAMTAWRRAVASIGLRYRDHRWRLSLHARPPPSEHRRFCLHRLPAEEVVLPRPGVHHAAADAAFEAAGVRLRCALPVSRCSSCCNPRR